MKIPMFPCKYHQNGGFSMAMLVLGRVKWLIFVRDVDPDFFGPENLSQFSVCKRGVGTRLPSANELIQVLFDTGIIKIPILRKSSNANVW